MSGEGLSPGTGARAARPQAVVVRRALPTDPSVRSAESLYMAETAGQGGFAPGRTLLGVARVPAPAHVSGIMGLPAGTPVIVRTRLMSAGDVPVRISHSYFPASAPESGELLSAAFLPGGLQAMFERYGRRFGRAEETLVARMPTAWERQTLGLDPCVPVVRVLRTSYDQQAAAVHILESICAADRHVFTVTQAEGDRVF